MQLVIDFFLNSNYPSLDDDDDKAAYEGTGERGEDSVIGIVLERDPREVCLFDYLSSKKVLGESEAKMIIKQLVRINLGDCFIFSGNLRGKC